MNAVLKLVASAAWSLLRKNWKFVVAYVLVVAGVLFLAWRLEPPKPPTTVVTPPSSPHAATTTVITDPDRTERRLLELQAQNAQLLDELKRAHAAIASITHAVGELKLTMQGPFTPVPGPTGPQGQPGQPGADWRLTSAVDATTYRYTDWRLTFTGDTKTQQASYDLRQRFEVTHVTGRGKDGAPVSLLSMFEVAPNGAKTEVQATVSTTVVDQALIKWRVSPTIQAGLGYGMSAAWPLPKGAAVGMVSLQLLKRGRSAAAEDSTMAALSPVITVSNGAASVGLVPVAVNLGRLPHQPFRDLWLSPYAAWNLKTQKVQIGLGVLASF